MPQVLSLASSHGGAEPTVVAIRGVVSRYPVAPLAPEQMLGGRVNICIHLPFCVTDTYNIQHIHIMYRNTFNDIFELGLVLYSLWSILVAFGWDSCIKLFAR